MNKFWVFLGGVAVGGLGTFIFMTKSVIPKLKREIRIRTVNELQGAEFMDGEDLLMGESYDSRQDERIVITENPVKAASSNNSVSAQSVDYSGYSKASASSTPVSAPAPAPEEDEELDDMDREYVYGHIEPYIIDEGSFDEYSSYRSKTFEVYTDGVIFDVEADEILDADPVSVFGSSIMEDFMSYKSREDVICVRDDAKKFDYRLERRDVPFNGPTGNYIPSNPDDWRD